MANAVIQMLEINESPQYAELMVSDRPSRRPQRTSVPSQTAIYASIDHTQRSPRPHTQLRLSRPSVQWFEYKGVDLGSTGSADLIDFQLFTVRIMKSPKPLFPLCYRTTIPTFLRCLLARTDPDPRSFWSILQHFDTGHFYKLAHSLSHENFITDAFLDSEIPTKF